MYMKKYNITADILFILSDCKVHTMQEIAEEVEVSEKTVRNHIQALTYHYPIQTFRGGINRGGVYLEKGYVYQGKVLTRDELQVISQALAMLQNSENKEVNQELLKALLERFALPTYKEQKDDERGNSREYG